MWRFLLNTKTSENQIRILILRGRLFRIFMGLFMVHLHILIPSLPSRHTLFIGDGIAVGRFLRVGSYRVTTCKVIIVDNEVMVIIDADCAWAVGVVEGAEGYICAT